MGRHPEWTPEKKAEAQAYICQQIALGRSLVSICKEPNMPHYSTTMEWRAEDVEFADKYARAREDQADYHAEEIVDIADTETDPNIARVRIDARKWKASKLKPKVYGEKLDLGGDLTMRVTDEQLESRLALLIGKAGAVGAARGEGTPEGEAEAIQPLPGFRASEA